MKIPETSANVGAYYGSDENGQWQPNGMIIDSGVGGGVVGSGDAGVHRPPMYPHHVPRPGPHIPGYVMAGAYYPAGYPTGGPGLPPHPGVQPDDFADYMWMENEEEFDKQQVMQQLEEEALMEQCIEAMLEDEQRERHTHQRTRTRHNGHNQHHPHNTQYPTTSNGNPSLSLEETVSRSTLNPLAAEFVPTRHAGPATPRVAAEDKEKPESPPEQPAAQEATASEEETPPSDQPRAEPENTPEAVATEHVEESAAEVVEAVPAPDETPEVSAADVLPDRPRPRERDARKEKDAKKPTPKMEAKKAKPQVVKSETRVAPKKKEVRSVKSDARVEEKQEEAPPTPAVVVVEAIVKPQPTPVEEPAPLGPKPINYAAAAKANKPRKPTTPPSVTDKAPPTIRVVEKTLDKKPKVEKPIQRKNSAK